MRPGHLAGVWWVACVCALGVGQVAAQSQAGALPLIAVQGSVVLGYSVDAPPFSVAQANGVPVGYSLDWCHHIVNALRTELNKPALKVRYVAVGQDQMARVVASGGVHLMCAAVSDTPERRQTMRFSEPIAFSATKFLVRADSGVTTASQLQGQRVGVLDRTSTHATVQDFSQRQSLHLQVTPVLNADAAMGQLALRQVKAWARDESLLLAMRARQSKPDDFVLLPEALAAQPIAIAFAKDLGLQRVVDLAMAQQVRTGEADRMYAHWFVEPNPLFVHGLGVARPAELTQAWHALK